MQIQEDRKDAEFNRDHMYKNVANKLIQEKLSPLESTNKLI